MPELRGENGEVWLPVDGWPYDVSSNGRVRRRVPGPSTFAGKILKGAVRVRPGYSIRGYRNVVLCRGSRAARKSFMVHKLVATAFLGSTPAGFQVNHINGDSLDNRSCNLEYVTAAENTRHAFRIGHGARGERSGHAIVSEAIVRHIRSLYARGQKIRVIAARLSLNKSHVYKIAARLSWKHVL